MQADLEKHLGELMRLHRIPIKHEYMQEFTVGYYFKESAVREIVRALLEGKVLCEKEPVYMFRRRGQRDWCSCDADRYAELGAKNTYFEVQILYAPASLAGNADIGKVQGAFNGQAPCKVCGYNGPGFYQPSTHACSGKEGGE